ncbi:MAG: hypothetical protein IPJ89_03405 [Candidatus Iainarchaeum archaeon]|uniref:Uncharacterized protein n=1 Tax=Candidatus Iainarchaeum sp. TaxID=3101447 RepID=A0A7T9I1Z8_9ARCH|nr:MAG: hypothetical protein IPJ89_03405 [Candidatus Diapherotrites archaeon]
MSSHSELFPSFDGTERERAEKCIQYINRTIRLKRLDPVWLLSFATHSPEEIMRRKKAFVAFPCLDLSIVGAELLVRNHIPSQIIIEQRQAPGGMEVHHYTLALSLDGKPMQIKVGRGLHLSDEPLPSAHERTIKMRDPTGKKIEGRATRKLTVDYAATHARDPAFAILGYSSRRYLRHSMNWTLPVAFRNLIVFNSAKFAQRVIGQEKKSIMGHTGKASMVTRFMLALKRVRARLRRKSK